MHNFISGKHLDALIEVFAERGLILRHGKWEFQENKRLHDNFTAFAREFKQVIGNPVDFVVTSEDKERHNDVQKLVKPPSKVCYCVCLLYICHPFA